MAHASIKSVAQAIINLSSTLPDSEIAKTVASYLISERRTADLDKIMRQVALIRFQNGIEEINVTSAFPISTDVRAKLKNFSKASNDIVINEIIDKNVIGGVKLEANNFYLDLTVRNRLNKLKVGV